MTRAPCTSRHRQARATHPSCRMVPEPSSPSHHCRRWIASITQAAAARRPPRPRVQRTEPGTRLIQPPAQNRSSNAAPPIHIHWVPTLRESTEYSLNKLARRACALLCRRQSCASFPAKCVQDSHFPLGIERGQLL